MPATKEDIEKYLGSGFINGLGEKTAKSIVSKFGEQTFDVMDNDIEKLLEVEGIGKGHLDKIRESWQEQKEVKNIMLSFSSFGVSSSLAVKIYKQYGKGCVEKIKDNPYCLADDIDGIGFKRADSIAQKLGFDNNDIRRCKSGIIYCLKELANTGHVFSKGDQLANSAIKLLNASSKVVVGAIGNMIDSKDLIYEDDALYLPSFYNAEVNVANILKQLMGNTSGGLSNGSLDMKRVINKTGVNYNDDQISAIKQAAQSKVMVLTGGPGTGKTTTTLGIIAAFESLGQSILLAAPTARAAKRMSEATGKEAKTIHRLLEFNPVNGYGKNANNQLEGDVLIIDESSMIDLMLMNSLLKAVPSKMRLILVGDIDQLPSVGAGNVLRDIIDSDVIPVVRLTIIFRQAQDSRIITNAHKINQGIFPDISSSDDSDFLFVEDDDPVSATQRIVDLVKNSIPKEYAYTTNDIQVLSPMKKGQSGTIELNKILQNNINSVGDSICHGDFCYRKNDRVMQIKNNYDKDVFNGDVGVIESIDVKDKNLTVLFDDKKVEYKVFELDELTLAYAMTIHKSQGSEYPVVVIPLLKEHYIMLQRNLIYTGITRAKKLCIIVGSKQALELSVNNNDVQRRNTKLKERLRS